MKYGISDSKGGAVTSQKAMDTLTMNIKREWFCEIVSGQKRVDYRVIKPYWERRLAKLTCPFRLRLINGMSKRAPEATVVVTRVRANRRSGQYELSLGKILFVENWDRRRQQPN